MMSWGWISTRRLICFCHMTHYKHFWRINVKDNNLSNANRLLSSDVVSVVRHCVCPWIQFHATPFARCYIPNTIMTGSQISPLYSLLFSVCVWQGGGPRVWQLDGCHKSRHYIRCCSRLLRRRQSRLLTCLFHSVLLFFVSLWFNAPPVGPWQSPSPLSLHFSTFPPSFSIFYFSYFPFLTCLIYFPAFPSLPILPE